MTGMRISNNIPRWGLFCAFAGLLHADDIILNGSSARLTGTVRSITDEGLVELLSPLSPGTVMLKGSAVRKVEFSSGESVEPQPTALVELANGDRLPVTVESFDDTKLVVVSPDAGRLEIPRDSLMSLQLGIKQRKLVYSGPTSLEEWSALGDMKNLEFSQNRIVANGQATASRKVALPKRFVLSFTLKWEAKQIPPNFEVYFADPLKQKGEASDRYFMRFNSAGLEIKREASEGKRYSQIIQINRAPNQYPDRELHVEIRVDRQISKLQLLLNGEPDGEGVDPVKNIPVPAGDAITFVCNTQNGNLHEIRDIEVFELDDSRVRHRAEDRGDPKSDSLISRDEDRWGGRLLEIRKSDEADVGSVFRFKSDFQDEALEIPENEVSTVFFTGREDVKPNDAEHPFVLRLRGDGFLRLASCRFTEDAVSAVHPLLGALNFRRDGVVAMERIETKPETKPEP
jgi:hypothetical protein